MAQTATTVRISTQTHRVLQELAQETGEAMSAIIDRAIADYHTKRFWQDVEAGYAALQSNPAAWDEELAERKLWEATLGDGLEKE